MDTPERVVLKPCMPPLTCPGLSHFVRVKHASACEATQQETQGTGYLVARLVNERHVRMHSDERHMHSLDKQGDVVG